MNTKRLDKFGHSLTFCNARKCTFCLEFRTPNFAFPRHRSLLRPCSYKPLHVLAAVTIDDEAFGKLGFTRGVDIWQALK